MTVSNQLVVPITLWGNKAPTHCISAITLTRDQKTIVTGCNDGRICIWDMSNNEKLKIVPRCLLFGHTAPVLCLTHGSVAADSTLLVSSSEAGEMSLWDLTDGRCLESVKLPYIHTAVHSYNVAGTNDVRLFCNGYYAQILVMDVLTLDILFTLSSRVNPDWISAMHVLRPAKSQDDVIVGISAAGMVKVWTLSGNESKNEPIYENESKSIRCLNALKLTCCSQNQRTVLIVCSKYWQIYDARDFSLLCSCDNPCNERWLGGDFIAADKVIVWSDLGKGYMFKLPTNCNPENKDYRTKPVDQAVLYHMVVIPNDKRLLCPPVMCFAVTRNPAKKNLLRGDSGGRISMWACPEINDSDILKFEIKKSEIIPECHPEITLSLQEAWDSMQPSPAGILDQMLSSESPGLKLTATVYLPLQGRLVCGREDGSIIIISATQTVLLQLLYGKHQTYEGWPPHQLLQGHNGRVNCLLYPHLIHNRYDIAHLLSGGVDFAVCLWDIYAGTMLHRFCVHAGEITQLLVPPVNCNNRVLQSVCSVASDHSVALLALKDKKCIMLASRHLFPIQVIKFRPLDDFMIVGCGDGSVYVWEMETGHLDRYVQGLSAEEILSACDENVVSGDRMTNPAIHFFRGLRHRNLAAIRHAAQRGLHQLHQPHHPSPQNVVDGTEIQRSRAQPLIIQGLRTNPKDQDSHVLFFDIEALVVQLLSEEYSSLSPGQLEVQGLINPSEQQKYMALSSSPEAQRKFSGLIAKMKDTAENAAQKIQAKAESVRFKTSAGEVTIRRKDSGESAESTDGLGKKAGLFFAEANLTMEIAQLLLSLLHAWGLDIELDRVCESKLGLLRPMRPVCFGLLSRGGHMALILPTYLYNMQNGLKDKGALKYSANMEGKHVRLVPPAIPPELVEEEERARIFSSKGHWELSTAMTTTHLLAVIALANTLMSMNSATFIPEQERRRKLHRRLSRADSKAVCVGNSQPTSPGTPSSTDAKSVKEDAVQAMIAAEATAFSSQQAHIKQGWSLLAALHCVLLPDLVKSSKFKCPQVEMLARRWQDRCLEVREAAQALLLAELRRISSKGRKQLVEEWAPYLPNYGEFSTSHRTGGETNAPVSTTPASSASSQNISASSQNVQSNEQNQHIKEDEHSSEEEDVEDHNLEEVSHRRPSSATEGKRKQTTAIVLLGVIGAEYGHEIETNKKRTPEERDQKRRSVVDGFGLSNYSLARHTSQALAFLLLVPPSPSFPAHTALRRAAIDLIGRGFTVWMPYLDVSKILLRLLELCCDSEKLVPSMSYGLPLTPAADSCRTARHALSLIALARPPAFITTLVKEVARYNTLAQNAQALNHSMNMTVLSRSKPEILRVIELLIDKMQTDVSDLIVEVMDIVIHCLDHTQLKARGLKETFPAICRFYNVTYCSSTRRIAVGAKCGTLAIYELRASKCQVTVIAPMTHYQQVREIDFSSLINQTKFPGKKTISAHAAAINACAFSPDGKFLASYSNEENKLCFWQTASGLFGLGNVQTRCIRTYNTPLLSEAVKNNPLRMARLQWAANKVVNLITDDNLEYRFSVT